MGLASSSSTTVDAAEDDSWPVGPSARIKGAVVSLPQEIPVPPAVGEGTR